MTYTVEGWTPSPRHLLRLSCLHDLTTTWPPGSVLETGAGTGHVTATFVDRGFTVTVHDIGPRSRQILRNRFGAAVTVVDRLSDVPTEAFDYLFAFEVLEHIVDDRAALSGWVEHLRPGGRVLLSVPAHQRKFGEADRAVGHVRRYERDELADLLRSSGLVEVQLTNYGFPLGNALRWGQAAADRLSNRRPSAPASDGERMARTVSSGVATSNLLNRARPLTSSGLMRPFTRMQRIGYGREWSDGFVVTARRPNP